MEQRGIYSNMSYSPLFRGNASTAPALGTATVFTNTTGSTLAIATPVSANASGQLSLTNVAIESTIEGSIGLVDQIITNGSSGLVMASGRVLNIPSLGFSVGDALWVGLTPGTLTNVKPDLTVSGWNAGYYVIFVGVVVKNILNPSNQDIQVSMEIIGQL